MPKWDIDSEELYFLFPVKEDNTETQFFDILLKYDEVSDLDRFNLTLAELSFNEIATCNNSKTVSNNSLDLPKTNFNFPVISEILHCEYKDGFNYATMKLVIEQFTDALVKNNSPVEIVYSEEEGSIIILNGPIYFYLSSLGEILLNHGRSYRLAKKFKSYY